MHFVVKEGTRSQESVLKPSQLGMKRQLLAYYDITTKRLILVIKTSALLLFIMASRMILCEDKTYQIRLACFDCTLKINLFPKFAPNTWIGGGTFCFLYILLTIYLSQKLSLYRMRKTNVSYYKSSTTFAQMTGLPKHQSMHAQEL